MYTALHVTRYSRALCLTHFQDASFAFRFSFFSFRFRSRRFSHLQLLSPATKSVARASQCLSLLLSSPPLRPSILLLRLPATEGCTLTGIKSTFYKLTTIFHKNIQNCFANTHHTSPGTFCCHAHAHAQARAARPRPAPLPLAAYLSAYLAVLFGIFSDFT